MKKQKYQKEFCRVPKCFNVSNNFYEKWQLDLCILHLIEFIRWFKKDEKINIVFNKFCDKWEMLKDSNQNKNKQKVKKKN